MPTDGPLYDKFNVTRTDGTEKSNARYFVLDYINDSFARQALIRYVQVAAANGYTELAESLRNELIDTSGEYNIAMSKLQQEADFEI